MIAQNEINVQGELANKTDNCAVSYRHLTGRILEQIKSWCLYDYSIPKNRWETHLTSLCNQWTKNKIVLFLYYKRYDMNFHSCKKQIFKFFGSTKIRNNTRWTKTSQKEVMQPTTSNSVSWLIFPYHVHNQADFEKIFINGRGFICLEFHFLSIYKSSW